jgi:hypothetical protein
LGSRRTLSARCRKSRRSTNRTGQIANAIIITGQSQGSGASLGATRLAPSYAPDLNIKASIATGIVSRFPAADKSLQASRLLRVHFPRKSPFS